MASRGGRALRLLACILLALVPGTLLLATPASALPAYMLIEGMADPGTGASAVDGGLAQLWGVRGSLYLKNPWTIPLRLDPGVAVQYRNVKSNESGFTLDELALGPSLKIVLSISDLIQPYAMVEGMVRHAEVSGGGSAAGDWNVVPQAGLGVQSEINDTLMLSVGALSRLYDAGVDVSGKSVSCKSDLFFTLGAGLKF